MPSRQPAPSPAPYPPPSPPPSAAVLAAFSLLLLLAACFRRKPRTAPADSKPPYRFAYSSLRRATSSFSPSLLLGRGGFGSVYRATLQNPARPVAVKAMDSGSLQGEREFQNELFFAVRTNSEFIASVIGFSSDRKRRRMLLVYELMPRGSLQHCLLHYKSPELKNWGKRFQILLDIARGLEYLHHECDPAIIHGDIKPSNVLLDDNFRAKIGDFGLARLKSDCQNCELTIIDSGAEHKNDTEDNASNAEETESVTTAGLEEFVVPKMSPEPETVLAIEKGSLSESNFDRASIDGERRTRKKDWWWKQENGGEGGEGVVKDYVMEWIGSEIKKERPNPRRDWIGAASSSRKPEKKKSRKKRLDWWMAMDDDKDKKNERRRPVREWWKEEYCEELARKNKKKKKKNKELGSASDDYNSECVRPIDDDFYVDRSKKKKRRRRRSKSRGSLGSMDWWLDVISHDSGSGEIHKSSGVSSTPSMRGTVCYVAPEYGRDNDLSEKCDVYSFGVLLLVLVAGRRPLQVTGSPLSEFQRANLISWSRHLARTGKLLDLVDKGIEHLDREQALLCITIALLCIQKLPSKRPSMKEVVGMLSGELDSPPLPVEFSPSPPCRFPFKSKKGPNNNQRKGYSVSHG